MSITINSIEESLSVAYVGAIVAQSGFSYDVVSQDYGVDVSIRNVVEYENEFIDCGLVFDCQLKATINWTESKDNITYPMKVKAYNKLIYKSKKSSSPCILVVLCLPKDESEWLNVTCDELKMRKSCYYTYINGEKSNNKEKISIKISTKNLLTPESIIEIKKKIDEGGSLDEKFK